MREILFRGKRLDNGEWVEGCFVEKKDPLLESDVRNAFILAQARGDSFVTWFPVDPSTVGQFTGLLDKSGKRIFEGDVFRDGDLTGVVEFRRGGFLVEWSGYKGQWTENGFDEGGGEYGVVECEALDFYYIDRMEVIDNIHDNPELLEKKP